MAKLFLNSLILTVVLERLGRASFAEVLRFAAGSPLIFLCNICIISTTLSLSYLAGKRRPFFRALIAIVWVILGTVNCVVLHYRMTPFSAEDFKLISALTKILKNYMTPGLIVLLAAGIAAVLVLIVVLFLKMPKETERIGVKSIVVRIGGTVLLLVIMLKTVAATNALSDNFENLAEAYKDYGFAYCFCNSLVKSGISEPDVYNQARMKKIADDLHKGLEKESAVNESEAAKKGFEPNILMIQLESFFDPYYLPSYQCSEDPIPFFRSLKEDYPSGLLRVPVVGAGTVNTEFEILTGMSTSYFGPGEYPYNTILREVPAESLAYILSSQGYTSTVIHNNTGTFYNRHEVFSKLGFDCFVPSEYMYDLEYTPTNWATDEQLPDLMLQAMEQSEGRDFVYTITVQSHGRYPEEEVLEDPVIKVRGPAGVNVNPAVYYDTQIRAVDNMVRDLVERLEQQDEPVILVLFGDHLPSFGYEEEEVALPDLYETEYVIWSNFDTGLPKKRLTAEAMSTTVLRAAGLDGGILPAFHRVFEFSRYFDEYLNLLEYDMLYGEGWIFDYCQDLLPGSYAGTAEDAETTGEEPAADETGNKADAENPGDAVGAGDEAGIESSGETESPADVRETEATEAAKSAAGREDTRAVEEAGAEEAEAPEEAEVEEDREAAQDEEESPVPYIPTDLRFGLTPVIVDRVQKRGDRLYVLGAGFNESSCIAVDGKIYDTEYIDSGMIFLDKDHASKKKIKSILVEVFQCDENMVPIGPAAVRRSDLKE